MSIKEVDDILLDNNCRQWEKQLTSIVVSCTTSFIIGTYVLRIVFTGRYYDGIEVDLSFTELEVT